MPSSQIKTSIATALKALNHEQKLAVDTIDGPVMVVAGPGTGKTQTITLRIANIIKTTDTPAGSILALTFTDSGAVAMKERLFNFIGLDAYRVQIHTFHSFCLDVIRNNPDFFFFDLSSDPLSDLEKLKIIHAALDSLPISVLRPLNAPYHYAHAVLGALSDLKREGVSPEQLARLLDVEENFLASDASQELKKTELTRRTRNLSKNRELKIIYEHYQQILSRDSRFDFDDMVGSVVSAFRAHPDDLLLSYQERFLYFLVDEYQDTNSAQNQLLLLLASYWGDSANLFVTGDPDQSIMRFQGASIENQLSFLKVYPQAKVITLTQNYRSPQTVLDAAHNLISHNNLRINDVVPNLDPHLISQQKSKPLLESVKTETSLDEINYIGSEIKKLLQRGVNPNEIAIIYRKNADANLLIPMLNSLGIPYNPQGGVNLLSDPVVNNLLNIFKLIVALRDKTDDTLLFTVLHYPCFQLDPLIILEISRSAADSGTNLFEAVLASHNPKLIKIRDLLLSFQAISSSETLPTLFEHILKDIGYLDYLLSLPDSAIHLTHLSTLFDTVKSFARTSPQFSLVEFLDNLEVMRTNNLSLPSTVVSKDKSAIILTTAHKSKGLEWDHVFIFKCVDGVWGNNKKPALISLPVGILENTRLSSKSDSEEERCLFYVALTRAKKRLTLTRSNSYLTGGRVRACMDSIFLAEIGDSLCKTITPEPSNLSELPTIFGEPSLSPSQSEQALLSPLVAKFKLSATSLNSYLHCPYKFKLEKILRLPQAKKPHLAFGTAIHAALEYLYKTLKDSGQIPPLSDVLSSFTIALNKEILSPLDHDIRHAQGIQILSSYYEIHHKNFTPPLFTEKSCQVNLGDIILTGKIDRLDWLDPKDRTLRIIDYKTGKSKTLGQIKGETQDSEGDLFRQLVFYKLLIDLDSSLQNIVMGEGVLDFIEEPFVSGKDGRRNLTITPSQVEDLKNTIKEVMGEIRALHFPRTTNIKHCENCPFRDHCYPQGLPNNS